jgi:hypothetical protein
MWKRSALDPASFLADELGGGRRPQSCEQLGLGIRQLGQALAQVCESAGDRSLGLLARELACVAFWLGQSRERAWIGQLDQQSVDPLPQRSGRVAAVWGSVDQREQGVDGAGVGRPASNDLELGERLLPVAHVEPVEQLATDPGWGADGLRVPSIEVVRIAAEARAVRGPELGNRARDLRLTASLPGGE